MQKNTKKYLFATIVAIGIILAGLFATYFTVWRTPDTTYDSALKSVADLQGSATLIQKTFEDNTSPAQLASAETMFKLKTAETEYSQTLTKLASSAILSDSKVKESYAIHKLALDEYIQKVQDITNYIDKYYILVLDKCSALTDLPYGSNPTTAMVAQLPDDCTKSINDAKNAPSNILKDQFISTFIDNQEFLVQSYTQISTASKAKTLTKAQLNKFDSDRQALIEYTNTPIVLSTPEVPSGAIESLKKNVTAQKSTFWR